MTDTLHPARSEDFLSRLYDGELSLADREAFETHRPVCDECRAAADAFEATLAAFRASPTAPPAADLSARILRKIRAQSPSRRPFGVMFGIDVRWAGVLLAALLVVLVSTPLVVRRKEASELSPPSIPARILDDTAQANAPQEKAKARPKDEPASAASAPAPATAPLSRDEAPARNAAEAPRQKLDTVEAPADEEKRRYAPPPVAAVRPPAPRREMSAQAPAVEAAAGAPSASGVSESAVAPIGLSVRALDGQGPAPAIVSHPPDERFSALRGLEFIVTVETQGGVRAVQAATGGGLVAPKKAGPADATPTSAGAEDALHELRFAPGDRPRRLLLRVE